MHQQTKMLFLNLYQQVEQICTVASREARKVCPSFQEHQSKKKESETENALRTGKNTAGWHDWLKTPLNKSPGQLTLVGSFHRVHNKCKQELYACKTGTEMIFSISGSKHNLSFSTS